MCKRYLDPLPLTHSQWGTWPVTQACALNGHRTSDLMVLRPALSPLSHSSWGWRKFQVSRFELGQWAPRAPWAADGPPRLY